jgi:CRISPR-associated protein Csx10
LRLTLDLVSPLVVPDFSTEAPADDGITGSALRGALAALYLRTGSAHDALFGELFLDGTAWPNMHPFSAGVSRPVPLSAVTCSRFPGPAERDNLATPPSFGQAHGLDDLLLVSEAAMLSGNTRLLLDRVRCPWCARQRHATPLQTATGFLEQGDGARYHLVEMARGSVGGAAVDRSTGLTLEDSRYQRQTIAAGRHLRGVVLVDSDLAATYLAETLLPVGRLFSVGRGRSRGLGQVRVRACERTADSVHAAAPVTLQEALQRFVPESPPGWSYTSVTLQSDVILLDAFFRFQSTLSGVDVGLEALERRQQFVRRRVVGGWNAAAGLPKEQATAIARGSALLYRYPTEQGDEVRRALAQVADEGIGERRAEGFGRVSIDDPFHVEVHELWSR